MPRVETPATTMSDDITAALALFEAEGLDPRTVNIPAIAAAEGKSCLVVAERHIRAYRIATQRDQELGTA